VQRRTAGSAAIARSHTHERLAAPNNCSNPPRAATRLRASPCCSLVLAAKSAPDLLRHHLNRSNMFRGGLTVGAQYGGARVISVKVNRHAMAMQFAKILADEKVRPSLALPAAARDHRDA
jgi:hypothetical protein